MKSRSLGRQVREWRHARGLSLEQAAALVGTTSATLSRLERGLHRPRRKLAMRVSEILGQQPLLPLEWRREPRLDDAAREFIAQAAARKVKVPADLQELIVWRASDGAFLILPIGGAAK